MKATAVVKREPPRGAQPSTSPGILDIELTVMLPTSPTQVTFAPNHLTVAGGVLVEQAIQPADPTKSVLLIRPQGTVARDVSPLHDGDKVTIRRVDGY